eukprot:2881371-Rhodomonas_salina.4
MHFAWRWQLSSCPRHSSILNPQGTSPSSSPYHPSRHEHWKLPSVSTHVALSGRQVWAPVAHSSRFEQTKETSSPCFKLVPIHPGGQTH